MDKKVANIVVSFDSIYLNLGKTMLVSLIRNNHFKMNIYLLYSNLEEEQINDIDILLKRFNKEVKFIPIYIDKNKYKEFFTTEVFPIEACYRLIIQDVLPQDIDRALWLDSDLIIRGSLYEFYYQPFINNCFVACEDMSMVTDIVNSNLQRLNLDLNSIYFNSGVLLLNLKDIRREKNLNDYFEFMSKNKKKLKYPDQDVINSLYVGKIKHNWCYLYNLYISANHIYKDKNDKKKIKRKTLIFHYICKENKPTNYQFNNFAFDEFWKYGKYVYGVKKYISIKVKNKIYRIKELIRGER